jgi:hypothetical protein
MLIGERLRSNMSEQIVLAVPGVAAAEQPAEAPQINGYSSDHQFDHVPEHLSCLVSKR